MNGKNVGKIKQNPNRTTGFQLRVSSIALTGLISEEQCRLSSINYFISQLATTLYVEMNTVPSSHQLKSAYISTSKSVPLQFDAG
jgi:hypothetical protein